MHSGPPGVLQTLVGPWSWEVLVGPWVMRVPKAIDVQEDLGALVCILTPGLQLNFISSPTVYSFLGS